MCGRGTYTLRDYFDQTTIQTHAATETILDKCQEQEHVKTHVLVFLFLCASCKQIQQISRFTNNSTLTMPLPLRFAFLFALCAVALGGIAAQPTFSSWTTINQQPYRYLTDVNILHSSQSVSLTLWVSYEYDCHFYFDYPTELDSTGVFCTYAPIECSIGKGDQTVVCTSFSQDLYYNQGSSSFSVLSGLSGTALIPSVGSAEWVTVIDSSFNLHQRIGGLGSSGSWTSIASNVLYASVGLDGTLCFLTTTSNSPLCCALLSTGGCSSPPENGIPYGAAVGCSVSDRNNIICWDGYGNLHYVVNGFDVATWSWYAIPMPSGVTVSSAFLSETPGIVFYDVFCLIVFLLTIYIFRQVHGLVVQILAQVCLIFSEATMSFT